MDAKNYTALINGLTEHILTHLSPDMAKEYDTLTVEEYHKLKRETAGCIKGHLKKLFEGTLIFIDYTAKQF